MNQLKLIGFFLLFTICFSCDDNDEKTQEQEAQELAQMFFEIEELASSVECEDASEWAFTGYGSKPCGGYSGYIAYSKNIDTTLFLKKVEEHRIATDEFNKKWGLFSNCSLVNPPTSIICEDGKPTLLYEYK